MAITIGSVDHLTLTVVFQDFRGQKMTKKIDLNPVTPDSMIILIIQSFDNLSNAKVLSASVAAERVITGTKTAAVSTGHEVNIDEVMELVYSATNPINPALKTTRVIGIPAMVSACEQTDGSPIAVSGVGGDTSLPPILPGVGLDMYNLISSLEANLSIKAANGVRYVPGFTWSQSRSHHIGIGDVVDSY